MRMVNYLYQLEELNIKELGKELDNCKKKMQQFTLRFLRQTEAELLLELKGWRELCSRSIRSPENGVG